MVAIFFLSFFLLLLFRRLQPLSQGWGGLGIGRHRSLSVEELRQRLRIFARRRDLGTSVLGNVIIWLSFWGPPFFFFLFRFFLVLAAPGLCSLNAGSGCRLQLTDIDFLLTFAFSFFLQVSDSETW